MAAKSLEERVALLEESNNKLKSELERTQAINEITNLVDRLQWLHTAGRDREISNLFAKNVPDVRVYWCSVGYWEGPDEIVKPGKTFPGSNPGHMPIHLMANPIIEVAKDGKTAKGVWIASGMVAMKDRQTDKPAAMWEWNRYGIDFIKEDGQWKLWHHHVFDLFGLGWDEKWEDQFNKPPHEMTMPDEIKPTHPPTPLDVGYSPDAELPYLPYPEPYETWADVTPY